MVSNLPYFHVWFDVNGGLGHIIEEPKEWPQYFGRVIFINKQVLASILRLEDQVHLWRKPRDIDAKDIAPRAQKFHDLWTKFDWTRMI